MPFVMKFLMLFRGFFAIIPKNNMSNQAPNKTTSPWPWKVYFFIYLIVVAIYTGYFFSPESPMHLYHQILIAYDIAFLVPYCFDALSIILNVFCIVPIYLFICRKNFLSLRFWRYIFLVKVIFDVAGKSYEMLFFKSLFYQSVPVALKIIGLIILVHLPAYIAISLYSFKKDYYPEA